MTSHCSRPRHITPARAEHGNGAGEKPLEGAIYAETIPFNETRDYVKKVMSNSMYYARSFGHQITALKNRLGIVASRSGVEKISEEENKP